jgi:hypothetical protein
MERPFPADKDYVFDLKMHLFVISGVESFLGKFSLTFLIFPYA